MDANSVVEIVKAVAWPVTVSSLLLIFRTEIRQTVTRLLSAKLPGGTELAFGTTPSDSLPMQSPDALTEETDSNVSAELNRPANLFWLGNDLMWTRDVILRAGAKQWIVHGLIQSLHHVKALGLAKSSDGVFLDKVLKRVKEMLEIDLTAGVRSELANELAAIGNKIGGYIEAKQPGFDPGPMYKSGRRK